MTLYQEVINVTKPYLGPAAEPFIDRQCIKRLKIDPQALTKPQMAELIKWVETGAGLIMGDVKGKELAGKLSRL